MAAAIEKLLHEQAFFSGMAADSLRLLADCASERRVEQNEVLFHHGEPADRFYLLRSGRISVEIPAIMGPSLEIQRLGAGQILGWSWLIPPYRWSFQARAEEPTELLEFDGKAILSRCEQDPKLGYELLKRFSALMSERLDAARRKMMDEWNPPGFA